MSKRFYYQQQHGERKRAKLDFIISDHNFPLSQNNGRKDDIQDNWGDENDDEILLLASQACEQAYSGDNTLPDYSICMQPSSTSTQNFDPGPGTSTNTFTFKKPTTNALNIISTHLKDKCKLISSPLPGISGVIQKTGQSNMIDDMIFNDQIHKGDTDYVYRQMLRLQEENSKLKSENGKLLEKCVTKEGEVSILRTQLKTSQVAADNARLEKIKVQERVQMEWTDKLTAANNQLQDLRTQLDFKNLEITSVKEKCKMLELSKGKLTQVTVAKNDISSSHRNSTIGRPIDSLTQQKRVKTSSKNVQTEFPTMSNILELNIAYRHEHNKLIQLLPLSVEPTMEQHSLLDYNEKLQRTTDSIHKKCKVFSTFHRIPDTPGPSKVRTRIKMTLNDVYEDLAFIAADKGTEEGRQKIFKVFQATKMILSDVEDQLHSLAQRTTTAFQKEMDEKYIEATADLLVVTDEDLICGKPLFKEEQAITARRITSILCYVLENSSAVDILRGDIDSLRHDENPLMELINRICILLDKTSCAILYSGFLQAVTRLLERIFTQSQSGTIFNLIKTIIQSRPMLFVSCGTLPLLRIIVSTKSHELKFCKCGNIGNLKLDYDQGVLLYKKDSCLLQIVLKQIEAAVKCMEKQKLREQVVKLCQDLLLLYSGLSMSTPEKPSCECRQTFLQVIVFALRTCAAMMNIPVESECDMHLLSVCRCGLQVLQQCVLRDLDLCPQLGYNEGHLIEFCELMRRHPHDEFYSNMLSEVTSLFQASPEESPPSFHREPWLKSFRAFTLCD